VRIKARPAVPEIDGVDLRGMTPGSVREVSALIAAWLVAEGYAEPEMRRTGADTPPSAESGGLTIPDRRSRHRF
jgi:hypothetical protein